MNIYMILFLLTLIGFTIGMWLFFEKAGEKGWKFLIPFYNFYIWLQLIKKPLWWYVFLIIPFINVFVVLLMIVEVLKCYQKYGLGSQSIGVIFPFFYLPYLGFVKSETYLDPEKRPFIKKSVVREWADAIIFAVIAATIIRTFLIEAYTIPTSSMEKSLLVGDFLFVSKISYGPKVPNTPLSFPFAHHTLPLTKYTKSYLEWINLDYYRFPGFSSIENNDVVVFNYPDGDTTTLELGSNRSYYAMCKEAGRDYVWANYHVVSRPVDKRENFIKRCIGIPGDKLEIVDQKVFINGKELKLPENAEYKYIVKTKTDAINKKTLEKLDITDKENLPDGSYLFALTETAAEKLKSMPNILSVEKIVTPKGVFDQNLFPFDTLHKWNIDNFGPLTIPAAGTTVKLDTSNISIYERIIDVYEENDFAVKDGKIFINGKESTSYTFKMNYYWMMGDNRHNSADSRYWGFVPEDHIVGKAVFVWLSLDPNKSFFDGKIRWNKMFRFIN